MQFVSISIFPFLLLLSNKLKQKNNEYAITLRRYETLQKAHYLVFMQLISLGLFLLSFIFSLGLCVLIGIILEKINPSFWYSHIAMGFFVFALTFASAMVLFLLFFNLLGLLFE